MKFKLEGVEYEFDETKLLVREARELKHYTGMGLKSFGAGLQEGDADALVGMFYLAKRRAGEAVKWADFDELNLAALDMSEVQEPDAVPKVDEAAVAVVPGDPAPTNGAVHTSPPPDGVDDEEVLILTIS